MAEPIDLTCYRLTGQKPNIRPAQRERAWMDGTPGKGAYRCLPLTIANQHGWEMVNESPFEVVWDGSQSLAGLRITPLPGAGGGAMPSSHFGAGVLTWHVHGLFRTPPGWNLWVSGSPNQPKDGISPLSGVIETDWTTATFTMNWIVTRPNYPIRFDAGEPFCFFFPVERGIVDRTNPEFKFVPPNSDIFNNHKEWARSRDEFNRMLNTNPPANQGDTWQKNYMQGVDFPGQSLGVADHQTKIRAKEFKG